MKHNFSRKKRQTDCVRLILCLGVTRIGTYQYCVSKYIEFGSGSRILA